MRFGEPLQPFVDQGVKELRLLDLQRVPGPVEDGHGSTWVAFGQGKEVGVADHIILAAGEEQGGPVKRLRQRVDGGGPFSGRLLVGLLRFWLTVLSTNLRRDHTT